MFEHPLPTSIKPLKLARQEGRLTGYMPLKQLPLLAADCVSDEGRVEADIQLRMEGARAEIHGTARTTVLLTCQRCLEAAPIELNVTIALGVVSSEERASELPESLEPFMLEEEEVATARLLEQELILALPIVAYHSDCEPFPYDSKQQQVEGSGEETKPNPFAVLEQLKGKVKKSDN